MTMTATERIERRRENQRRYYAENPEKKQEKNRRWRKENSEKIRELSSLWRKANPTKRREQNWQSQGISLLQSEHDFLFQYQQGRCAICRVELSNLQWRFSECVDHDHVSKQIRGLLCQRCNAALGFLGDNEALVMSAFRFLRDCRENAAKIEVD